MGETTLARNVLMLAETWPGVASVTGQVDPRNIANSTSISEHSFGNALDIFGTREALESLAKHLDDRRGEFKIETLCYDPGVGRLYDHCTTKHTGHIHVDFRPGCGGIVNVNGTASQRVTDCENYQMTGDTSGDSGGGFLGIEGAINRVLSTGLYFALGGIIIVAGFYLLARDSDTFKTIQGAVTGAATKGLKGA